MWDEEFTDQQWLQLLHQRVHQPIAIWSGIGTGEVTKTSSGLSYTGLTFRDSPSHVIENHLISKHLLQRRPLLFLRLFDDPDPQVVLTGVYAYRSSFAHLKNLHPGDVAAIADAFRKKLLSYPDVRIRWAAIQTLGETRWLNVDDIRRGLDDKTATIRVTTAFWLDTLVWEPNERFVYDKQGQLIRGNRQGLDAMVDANIRLAPILLEHLNDTHFFVRHHLAMAFRHMFFRWQDAGKGARSEIKAKAFPAGCDWVRADWATRAKTQASWKRWWAERGPAEMRKVHGIAASEDSRAQGEQR